MKVEDIKKILVVGAGTMGHGIAEIAAISGYKVYLSDISQDILNNALERIRWSLSKLQERGQIKESVDTIMSRITTIVGLDKTVSDADFSIEASTERMDIKRQVFSKLDELLPPHAILATNTSSLPISKIAEATKRQDKVVGMHFFNPPVLMQLVEVMKGDKTSDETAKITYDLAKKFGKQPIMINKDVPGYVVNRILGQINIASCILVEKKVADYREVDAVARYKLGFPMGVFELIDYTGVDVAYYVSKSREELGIRDDIPICSLIEQKFKNNELGVKTGKGFYTYPAPGKYVKPELPKELADKLNPALILAGGVNEATRLLREGIASRDDIDLGVRLGLGLPKGIFQYADELGVDTVLKALEDLKALSGYNTFNPDPMITQMIRENKLGIKTGSGFYQYGKVEEKKMNTLIIRIEPPLAWIILNRPERLNALNPELVSELDKSLDELESRSDVRVVIITGNGRAFSAGADVSSFITLRPIDVIRLRTLRNVVNKIALYTKPIIAGINGFALGGGLELAMACDIRIASEVAQLGQPEINIGIIPGAGGTQRLPRLVGKGKAKLMIYTGDMVSAEDAYKMGLVDLVVPSNRFEEEVRRVALKIAEKSPISLLAAKLAIELGYESNIWTGQTLESTLFGLLFTTKDVEEGVKAFLEKRKPQFKGE
ncbi:3-hydroxyacyl-CoA dehydrogenase/enoyl-CoA hydratase family protein [Saccharolobus solfataricus]|uniref:3-hydroxyacyl-CoA dehydrogenase/enoyl CoA hydratase n=3 Tax=Saccharolobus solfataricus TaxID=2287 RepID=Q97VU5_SACS2|nr:3-hydroxyacyl-CoA dehydrogenase/enoyl-CoA hydratase family protein [Saccharolobus solfataricus]AAK42645.1 3-hydroxyacyl-CoA dehydrogenase/enoyl CoA hydratase [Saccharolobus solfataricus P2]AKA72741.1 3-hydroxyacyl-CoA dehydrogenase/enoyl-CoA hydratase family protein [Saccharolobus solfataricus]AKA75440.1 3-hydroxyacyl-CoA dehydrogenase/enoyl-CoA hydratase family protein [Saccharolobus solfataricus]AKA78133.1 3-hydroxyacyl-CoA dehydrogenase/enoyl-CoA hydratase family protein [Saccharolobus so